MEAELAVVFDDMRILQMARMFQLSAAVVVIYDHVLCAQREVDLIWRKPKSLVTFLYFTNRYVGDVIVIISAILFISSSFSVETCRVLFQFQAYGPFASVWATQLIMQLRIYAMYRKSKKILAFTAVCFTLEIAAICTVLAINFDYSLTYTNEPIPGLLKMCATSSIGRIFTAIYLPIVSFELLLFVLALFVAFKHMRTTYTVAGKRLHSTMATLVRYNTIYFFVEMVGCAIATTLYLGLPAIYLEITNSVLIAVTIILGSRLVLNIRNFYADPSEEDSNLSQRTSVMSHNFTQPSIPGPFYDFTQTEMSIVSAKGYRLNINGDRIV